MKWIVVRTTAHLQRDIAINAVIAWRLMVLTLPGRRLRDYDANLMFTAEELGFLGNWAREHGQPARTGSERRPG